MKESDERDAFLLLQLAESGRPVEQVAQFLASMMVSCDMTPSHFLDEVKAIAERTIDLLQNEDEIWTTLLPGGSQGNLPKWRLVEMEDLSEVADRITTSIPTGNPTPGLYKLTPVKIEGYNG